MTPPCRPVGTSSLRDALGNTLSIERISLWPAELGLTAAEAAAFSRLVPSVSAPVWAVPSRRPQRHPVPVAIRDFTPQLVQEAWFDKVLLVLQRAEVAVEAWGAVEGEARGGVPSSPSSSGRLIRKLRLLHSDNKISATTALVLVLHLHDALPPLLRVFDDAPEVVAWDICRLPELRGFLGRARASQLLEAIFEAFYTTRTVHQRRLQGACCLLIAAARGGSSTKDTSLSDHVSRLHVHLEQHMRFMPPPTSTDDVLLRGVRCGLAYAAVAQLRHIKYEEARLRHRRTAAGASFAGAIAGGAAMFSPVAPLGAGKVAEGAVNNTAGPWVVGLEERKEVHAEGVAAVVNMFNNNVLREVAGAASSGSGSRGGSSSSGGAELLHGVVSAEELYQFRITARDVLRRAVLSPFEMALDAVPESPQAKAVVAAASVNGGDGAGGSWAAWSPVSLFRTFITPPPLHAAPIVDYSGWVASPRLAEAVLSSSSEQPSSSSSAVRTPLTPPRQPVSVPSSRASSTAPTWPTPSSSSTAPPSVTGSPPVGIPKPSHARTTSTDSSHSGHAKGKTRARSFSGGVGSLRISFAMSREASGSSVKSTGSAPMSVDDYMGGGGGGSDSPSASASASASGAGSPSPSSAIASVRKLSWRNLPFVAKRTRFSGDDALPAMAVDDAGDESDDEGDEDGCSLFHSALQHQDTQPQSQSQTQPQSQSQTQTATQPNDAFDDELRPSTHTFDDGTLREPRRWTTGAFPTGATAITDSSSGTVTTGGMGSFNSASTGSQPQPRAC